MKKFKKELKELLKKHNIDSVVIGTSLDGEAYAVSLGSPIDNLQILNVLLNEVIKQLLDT